MPNKYRNIARQAVAAVQPMFTRLAKEVQTLRMELKELKNEKLHITRFVMPTQPFKKIDLFFDFEKELRESGEKFASFEKELTVVSKAPSFVKNCWRKIITDEIGEQLCWKGTETKKSVRNLTTAKAIKYAALSVGLTDDQFVKDTRKFFQFAKNRIKLRQNYKNNKRLKHNILNINM